MRPYSIDLRSRVLTMCDEGKTNCEVATIFSISSKTIYLWKIQRTERGSIKPITKYQKGHSDKITDLDKFKEFVNCNTSLPASDMAKQLHVSPSTVLRNMKKIEYTRKKKLWVMSKEIKRYVRNSKKKFRRSTKTTLYIWTKVE